MIALDLLEHAHEAGGVDRGVDLDMQGLPVEVIDDVEGPEAPAAGQRIAHEVHRPDGVGKMRHIQRNAFPLGQAALGRPSNVQSHRLVHAVDALVVPVGPCPAQLGAALPEAPAGTLFHQSGQ